MAFIPLPTKPHPVASAFFSSHDDETRSSRQTNHNETTPQSMVARIRNSVGWRTRYSSSTWHPVSIVPVAERGCSIPDNDGQDCLGIANSNNAIVETKKVAEPKHIGTIAETSAPILFHVRQVFPRKNDRPEECEDTASSTTNMETHASEREDSCELGTGATVWPGSIILMKYLEKLSHKSTTEQSSSENADTIAQSDHLKEEMKKIPKSPKECHNVLKGKVVADLGSGTAITSIGSALLGANMVVCTDGCDPVVALAKQNVQDAVQELNNTKNIPTRLDETSASNCREIENHDNHFNVRGCKIVVRKYLWGDGTLLAEIPENHYSETSLGSNNESSTENKPKETKHFDIILCADCIVPKLYPIEPLVDAIDELSGNETISYLSYERRHYDKYDPAVEFLRLAKLRNLEVEIVPDTELHPMYPANDIEIWKVMRRDNNVFNCDKSSDSLNKVECSYTDHGDSYLARQAISKSNNIVWGSTSCISNNHLSLLVGESP